MRFPGDSEERSNGRAPAMRTGSVDASMHTPGANGAPPPQSAAEPPSAPDGSAPHPEPCQHSPQARMRCTPHRAARRRVGV